MNEFLKRGAPGARRAPDAAGVTGTTGAATAATRRALLRGVPALLAGNAVPVLLRPAAAALGDGSATRADGERDLRDGLGSGGRGLPNNTGDNDPSPEWDALRTRLYGDAPILVSGERIAFEAPRRAAYGSSVPVRFIARLPQTAALHVDEIRVIVDRNPSPVAATITTAPELGDASFETRLRVDTYSHVRVVTRWSDGQIHMAARYVKTSGGCSAPPNREHPELVGTVEARDLGPAPGEADGLSQLEFSVRHPNDSGFELNNVTVMYIPPHFVRSMVVRQAGRPVWSSDQDFSIAENPRFRIRYRPRPDAPVDVEVTDSKDQAFSGRLGGAA